MRHPVIVMWPIFGRLIFYPLGVFGLTTTASLSRITQQVAFTALQKLLSRPVILLPLPGR